MPYRRSLGRVSNRTWEDFNEEIHRAENEHLMEGIVAACAFVAYADGRVTEDERTRMLRLIRGFEPIAAFGLDDVTTTFASMTAWFETDQKAGEQAALHAITKLKSKPRYSTLLVEACCAIAAADGEFDTEERLAVIRICTTLGLKPESFGLPGAR